MIRIEHPPLLLAPLRQDGLASRVNAVRDELTRRGRALPLSKTGWRTQALRIGDRVALWGSADGEISRVDHFELAGATRSLTRSRDASEREEAEAPYRGDPGAHAELLRCTRGLPMILRRLPS